MDGSDLTDRQRAVLDFIVETVETRGFPPALRDICESAQLPEPTPTLEAWRTRGTCAGTLPSPAQLRSNGTAPHRPPSHPRQAIPGSASCLSTAASLQVPRRLRSKTSRARSPSQATSSRQKRTSFCR